MMNDVVSDPVDTFVRLATDSPWHQRPTSLPEGWVAFGGMRKVKFFYETLSVQSWPEASGRHFDVKNLWLWLQVFQPDTVSAGIGRLCGWRCFAKWCSVKWCFVKYWQGAGKKYYLVVRTKKRTTVSCSRPLWNLAMSDYSAGWMAPIGQASAQVPQSMQAFGSMV